MKQKDLHNLVKQHIPQIHYLECDTDELIEGECALWNNDNATIVIEFADNGCDCHNLADALQTVSAKLAWLNEHSDDITQATQTNPDTAYIAYAAFWVEDSKQVFCDFAVAPDLDSEQEIECSLEEDNTLVVMD